MSNGLICGLILRYVSVSKSYCVFDGFGIMLAGALVFGSLSEFPIEFSSVS